jgi:predicted DNA-binding transcriptional regulator AlpA
MKTIPDIVRATGFAKSSVYFLMAQIKVPKPAMIGNSYIWSEKDFETIVKTLGQNPGKGRPKEKKKTT